MGKYPPPVDEGGPLPIPSPPSIQRGQPSTSPPPEKPEGKPAAVMPDWKNAGAVPEANAYDKIFDSDAPGALVPLPGHSEASTEVRICCWDLGFGFDGFGCGPFRGIHRSEDLLLEFRV